MADQKQKQGRNQEPDPRVEPPRADPSLPEGFDTGEDPEEVRKQSQAAVDRDAVNEGGQDSGQDKEFPS